MLGEKAAIDNDFLVHLIETDISKAGYKQEELYTHISGFLKEVSPEIIMHWMVYENELMDAGNNSQTRNFAKELFNEGVIGKYGWDKILLYGETGEKYYGYVLEELYKSWKGDTLPVNDWKTEWKRKRSLGETHSIAMCVLIGCNVFLSDDKGSTTLANILNCKLSQSIQVCGLDQDKKEGGTLKVYNRSESLKATGYENKKLRGALGHKRA